MEHAIRKNRRKPNSQDRKKPNLIHSDESIIPNTTLFLLNINDKIASRNVYSESSTTRLNKEDRAEQWREKRGASHPENRK